MRERGAKPGKSGSFFHGVVQSAKAQFPQLKSKQAFVAFLAVVTLGGLGGALVTGGWSAALNLVGSNKPPLEQVSLSAYSVDGRFVAPTERPRLALERYRNLDGAGGEYYFPDLAQAVGRRACFHPSDEVYEARVAVRMARERREPRYDGSRLWERFIERDEVDYDGPGYLAWMADTVMEVDRSRALFDRVSQRAAEFETATWAEMEAATTPATPAIEAVLRNSSDGARAITGARMAISTFEYQGFVGGGEATGVYGLETSARIRFTMGEDDDHVVLDPPIVVPPDAFARLRIDFALSEAAYLERIPTAWIAKVEFLEGRRTIGSTDLFCVINGVLAY